MNKEPIYFQYLRGENKGKIVKLEQIDDISPAGNSQYLYYFDDGSKFFEEFIGMWGDYNAFKSGKILSLIPDINSTWKFNDKEIKHIHKTARGEDGTEYEIPDPYFIDRNTGKPLHTGESIKVSENANPPVYRRGQDISIPNYYYLSYKETYDEPKKDIAQEKEMIPEPVKEPEPQIIEKSPNIKRQEPLTINLDHPDTANDPIIAIIKDNEIIAGPEKLSNVLNDLLEEPETNNNIYTNNISEFLTISEPIKILVDSCKKTPQDIEMSINIDLPNKSFYDMLCENYGQDKAKESIVYIINNLDVSVIKDALKNSLIASYCESEDN